MFHRLIFAVLIIIVCVVFYPCYGEFCDEGPPGRYCLENLNGWHECIAGPKGMEDKLHYCPEKTRCKCYFGPSCSSEIKDPCGSYELPPELLGVSTGTFTGIDKVCIAGSCNYQETAGMFFIDSNNEKWREDLVQSTSRWTKLTLPDQDKQWIQYTIEWNIGKCTKKAIGPKFPRIEIPKYFQARPDTFSNCGHNSRLWEWKTGGHNRGVPLDVTRVYTANIAQGEVMSRWEQFHYGTEMSKEYFNRNRTFVIESYKPSIVGGDSVFDLPKFCQQ